MEDDADERLVPSSDRDLSGLRLAPGEELAPGIVLCEAIGSGGMAEVWRAHHLRLDIDVAVKVIRQSVRSATARRRFELEARVAARLRSPHVVRIFDHGETAGGHPYIVMELLDGWTLDDRLEADHRLSPREALAIGRQLAMVLDAAHDQGIVHRDIKPGNVWLCGGEDGMVKVFDFGIAQAPAELRAGHKLTAKGHRIGTPPYMSPEQLLGIDERDGSADRWGLGVCLYEMVTGANPFCDGNVTGVMSAVLEQRYEPATALTSEVGPAMDTFFARALAAEAPRRFMTARTMMDAFAEAIGDQATARDDAPGEASLTGASAATGSPSDEVSTTEPPPSHALGGERRRSHLAKSEGRTARAVIEDRARVRARAIGFVAVLVVLVVLVAGGSLAQRLAGPPAPLAERGLVPVPPLAMPPARPAAPGAEEDGGPQLGDGPAIPRGSSRPVNSAPPPTVRPMAPATDPPPEHTQMDDAAELDEGCSPLDRSPASTRGDVPPAASAPVRSDYGF